MALAAAGQAQLDVAVAMDRLRRLVRVALSIFPDAEIARRQRQPGDPGQHQHDPSQPLTGRLLRHLSPNQPPAGAAKRRTKGRTSPSARAWSPLSMPSQAPLSSSDRASATP
jgi:hypothetical protein